MKSSEMKVAASLRYGAGRTPVFWSLAPLVCTCLRRADIAIIEHTVGIVGESMEFETDHGRIELSAGISPFGRPCIDISTDIDRLCPIQTARQICFLLCSYITARHGECLIHWAPTRQSFPPEKFTWGALHDVPHPRAYGEGVQRSAEMARTD